MEVLNLFAGKSNNQIQTITSVEIAEMMEIPHRDILRKLEGGTDRKGIIQILTEAQMDLSDYFTESTYIDNSGKQNKCYLVTKIGCDFLANKFTGEKGVLFTAKYVKKFNDMENALVAPKSPAEMLLMYAQQFYEVEKKLAENDARLGSVENNIKTIEARLETHNEDYFTVSGYASLRGIVADISKCNMLGRKASKMSRDYGYDIGKTKDTRFGQVNTYHTDILKTVFDEIAV